jgi:hypothetical protein
MSWAIYQRSCASSEDLHPVPVGSQEIATYALLFLGAYTAALISGAAGFGSALLLLPLLVASVGVVQAVPLLTVAQFVGNLSRAGFGFSQIQWKPVALFEASRGEDWVTPVKEAAVRLMESVAPVTVTDMVLEPDAGLAR